MGFTNQIIGGAAALIRNAIKSPNYAAGATGWSINKDGSAEFSSLTIRGTFNGTNFVLKSSGLFFYSGIPATGNLIESITNAAGNDGLSGGGNAFLQGNTSYLFAAGVFTAVNMNGGIISWYESASASGPWTLFSDIGFAWNNLTGGSLLLQAGNQVTLGQLGNAVWDEVNQQLKLPAAGGPFISGESFHDISGGVGGVVARVKKLPWNAIWLDVEATEGATGTFNLATLPDSSYNPVRDRRFALGASAGTNNARVFVPTSPAAAVQLIVGGSGAWSGGASVMYPIN